MGTIEGKALTNLIVGLEEEFEESLTLFKKEDKENRDFKQGVKKYLIKVRDSMTELNNKNIELVEALTILRNSTKSMKQELDVWKEMFQSKGKVKSSGMSSSSLGNADYENQFVSDGDPRTHSATEWEFVPWYKAELTESFRRITLYIDGFSYSTEDIFRVYVLNHGVETECAMYDPQFNEYYTQTVVCAEPGDGFMISVYDQSGAKTILELYEVKVGIVVG